MDIGIESAAVEGYFTYEEVGQLKNILTRLRFDPNLVEIDGILDMKNLNPKERAGVIAQKIGFSYGSDMRLDGCCVRLINDQLRKEIGFPRNEWSISDFKRARSLAEEKSGIFITETIK